MEHLAFLLSSLIPLTSSATYSLASHLFLPASSTLEYHFKMPPDMQEPERMSINHANQDSDNGPSSEEATAMCQISSGAMEKKPEMIGALVDILSNTEREYADVTCAENDWPREIGVLIKDYLLRDKFADRWLYCGKDMDQVHSLILGYLYLH